MNIIKLSATSSTNDYLKELMAERQIENFTVVVAEHQTAGKGQMGAKWHVEPGKNLTLSILIKDVLTDIQHIFNLNVAVAISIVQGLKELNVPSLSIKWPNDILAGNKKIGGILIENTIKQTGGIHSIIGIGLNVNQTGFEGLPKASSLAVATGHVFDKEQVMLAILKALKPNIAMVSHKTVHALWETYHGLLFKKNIPAAFEKDGNCFMGVIQGVTNTGNLRVLLENDTIAEYGLKEISLLY